MSVSTIAADWDTYVAETLRLLERYGITHLQYCFTVDLQRVRELGLKARVGKEYSTIPPMVHSAFERKKLSWTEGLGIQHCWMRDEDFLWDDEEKWSLLSSSKQRKMREIWHSYGLSVGVSIPLRAEVLSGQTMGSAVLFVASECEKEKFRALYEKNASALHKRARAFDQMAREKYLAYFYPLSARDREFLKLYESLGDCAEVARYQGVGERTVQLNLQKIRKKLDVRSNVSALKVCQTFRLLVLGES